MITYQDVLDAQKRIAPYVLLCLIHIYELFFLRITRTAAAKAGLFSFD